METIPLARLALLVLPIGAVFYLQYRFGLGNRRTAWGVARMLTQLLVIGYFLAYLFEATSVWPILLVLGVMVLASSWIALGSVPAHRKGLYGKALLAVSVGGSLNLALVIFGVLDLDPWYLPSKVIPLAGMIFAASMNCVSLAAERYFSERTRGMSAHDARGVAYNAALIPIINSLFAVGLVSIPGMMTGQILSGVSPLIASRYQILVMGMLLGANGISAALFLGLLVRAERRG
ncbi:MAG: ABC transporter permease [Planctomycetes bacterium]|nr:ABC transporter permease [Planctomycetota bacterium]